MPDRKTLILQGIAASPGIVIGKAFLMEDEELCLVQKEISKEDAKKEVIRFREAISKTRAEMIATQEKIYKTLGKEYARLSDAYLLILEDPLITRDVIKKIGEGVNAEYALFRILERVIHSFEMIDDEYFRERKHDIQDVGKKILRHLLGKERRVLADITSESVIVAHNLTPADTISMRENLVKGFTTDIGGRTAPPPLLAPGLGRTAAVGGGHKTSP